MSLLNRERALYADVWSSVQAYGDHAPGEKYVPVFLEMFSRSWGAFHGVDSPEKWKHAAWTPSDHTLLDAGCGTAKGGLALAKLGFKVTLCDVTRNGIVPEAHYMPYHDACLWHDLAPISRAVGHPGRTRFDVVYCCDVLEHIPPQFTMLAIDQMLRVARYGVFLAVSLVPDAFGAWAGTSLHQTVQPYVWWRDSIAEIGQISEARDLVSNAVFLVRPR